MKTQAWGWLAVAALAAGMNATYHAGGMQWAHALAAEVENNTSAVLALASGRADEFLAQAQLVNSRHETAPCPFAAALAQVESRVSDGDEFRAMSVENEAKLAEL